MDRMGAICSTAHHLGSGISHIERSPGEESHVHRGVSGGAYHSSAWGSEHAAPATVPPFDPTAELAEDWGSEAPEGGDIHLAEPATPRYPLQREGERFVRRGQGTVQGRRDPAALECADWRNGGMDRSGRFSSSTSHSSKQVTAWGGAEPLSAEKPRVYGAHGKGHKAGGVEEGATGGGGSSNKGRQAQKHSVPHGESQTQGARLPVFRSIFDDIFANPGIMSQASSHRPKDPVQLPTRHSTISTQPPTRPSAQPPAQPSAPPSTPPSPHASAEPSAKPFVQPSVQPSAQPADGKVSSLQQRVNEKVASLLKRAEEKMSLEQQRADEKVSFLPQLKPVMPVQTSSEKRPFLPRQAAESTSAFTAQGADGKGRLCSQSILMSQLAQLADCKVQVHSWAWW